MEDEYRAKKIEAVTIELVPVRFDIKLLNIRQKFGLILVVNSRWYTPDIEVIVEKDGSIWVSAGFDENAKGEFMIQIADRADVYFLVPRYDLDMFLEKFEEIPDKSHPIVKEIW